MTFNLCLETYKLLNDFFILKIMIFRTASKTIEYQETKNVPQSAIPYSVNKINFKTKSTDSKDNSQSKIKKSNSTKYNSNLKSSAHEKRRFFEEIVAQKAISGKFLLNKNKNIFFLFSNFTANIFTYSTQTIKHFCV